MAYKMTVSCDICGKDKAEVNHWFKVWIDSMVFKTTSFENKTKSFENFVLNKEDAHVKDVCGTEHAMVMYNRFLANGTLEADKLFSIPGQPGCA